MEFSLKADNRMRRRSLQGKQCVLQEYPVALRNSSGKAFSYRDSEYGRNNRS
jgi:hypothetical protein